MPPVIASTVDSASNCITELTAAGADRCANRRLAGARGAADQQETRDIDVDDHQNERRQSQQ
jgi:hypothetical protein